MLLLQQSNINTKLKERLQDAEANTTWYYHCAYF